MNGWYRALEYVTWVFQLGFSLLFPPVCCAAACWWLTTCKGLGMWVWIPGLLLGLLVAGCTFASFVRYWIRQQDREDRTAKKPRRSGFNGH